MPAASFDVLVVGGGPAGTAAATTLARAQRSTCLVESSRYDMPRIGEHVPPRSAAALGELGLWDSVVRACGIECPGVRAIWGGPEPHAREYLFYAGGTAWHVDRAAFDRMLAEHAEGSGAVLALGTTLRGIVRDDAGWRASVSTADGRRELHARLVIDATGRAALVARRMGARRTNFDHLMGVAAWLGQAEDPDLMLLVEACENGWWYSAPTRDRRLVGVFMCDVEYLKAAVWRSVPSWKALSMLAPQTAERLRNRTVSHGPVALRAESAVLRPMSGPGWLAAGDAAMSVDPLSADGIMRALRSGMAAATAALSWLEGEAAALDTYARAQFAGLQSYLVARTRTYREEPRWSAHAFWKRRHLDRAAISLSPDDVLALNHGAELSAAVPGLDDANIERLCSLCDGHAVAQMVVRRFLGETSGLEDVQVIFALQDLVVHGVLERLAPTMPVEG